MKFCKAIKRKGKKNMYARRHNIVDVAGRIHYVRDKKNREEVVGFYNTASYEFWDMLAKENQEQFLRSSNAKIKGRRATEARELVIGLPEYVNDSFAAKLLAMKMKLKYGVECIVAIHKKWTYNEEGKRVLNVHAHIIFAERKFLPEPIFIEEKRASQNYYYNEKGKKCKKSEAVKVTHKGDITQEACVRYFTNKINFYNMNKLEPFINSVAKDFQFERFDISKHFPQRKIGKNNPKENFFWEHNKLVKEMNTYFDNHQKDYETPLKSIFL